MKIFKALTLTLASCTLLVGCSSNQSLNPKDKATTNSTMNSKKSEKFTGIFQKAKEHSTEGEVTIYDNKLTLSNFKADKAPDLRVYIAKGQDVKKGVLVGNVKNDVEKQVFNLEKLNVNLKEYDTVVIYCQKYHVVFGTAKYN